MSSSSLLRLGGLGSAWLARRGARVLPGPSRSGRAAPFASSAAAAEPPPTAALLIVGSEVLSGAIADANTPWLARLLTAQGVDLKRVVVVPDEEADVAAAARDLRARHPVVFVSGGIGPTADDVTYAALGRAFGLGLGLHAPTVARMRPHYEKRGVELNAARLRMATLPLWPRGGDEGGAAAAAAAGSGSASGAPPPPIAPPPEAEVLFTEGLWVPLVKIAGGAAHGPVLPPPPTTTPTGGAAATSPAGVYVLPGIPRLFQAMVTAHAARFRGPLAHARDLFSSAGEGDVAGPLGAVAERFPSVAVGSYVDVRDAAGGLAAAAGRGAGDGVAKARVRLSFTSRDEAALAEAVECARREVPGVM
jgi:molybdenum cofactor synthesis domain-containing protein